MKICLINPKSLANTGLSIPHGLLQISAELKKNGYSCKILDFNDREVKVSYAYLNTFDVVGLSVMTTQLKHATEIVDNLDKKVKVVWGGVHCLLDPLSILNKHKSHFVISGDGERPLLKLLEYFTGQKDIDFIRGQEGICCFIDKPYVNPPSFVHNLNELENIDYYDLPNLEKYIYRKFEFFKRPEKINMLSILTSRGCSWDCAFCINSIYRKHKAYHRSKAINKIKEEIGKVIDDFKVKLVWPQDEDFFINKELLGQWSDYAREKGFLWGADCRYNYFHRNLITEDELKELIRSGLFFVGMSIEAGLEDLRNRVLSKQLRDAEICNTVETIRRSVGKQLVINTSFIVNFPGDTKLNKIETIKWMDMLSRKLNIVFSGPQIYRAYPGSKLYYLESHRESGNLDYYLKDITAEGVSRRAGSGLLEGLFYSNLLPRYFNSRFSFFEIVNESGKPKIRMLAKSKWKPGRIIISVLFLPIKLRLKFNCWKLFFEPFLMGLYFWPLQKAKRYFVNLKNRLTLIPA